VNEGSTPLNISGIMGSVNDPLNFRRFLVNLTGVAVGEVVDPGSELALEYRFGLPLPEPMDVQVALTVFYEDDSEFFTSTYFNETISFVEAPKPWNARAAVPYAAGLAVVAAVAIMVRAALSGETPRGGRSGAAASSGAEELTYADVLARQRKGGAKAATPAAAGSSGGKKDE
jgi:hypothetical protein